MVFLSPYRKSRAVPSTGGEIWLIRRFAHKYIPQLYDLWLTVLARLYTFKKKGATRCSQNSPPLSSGRGNFIRTKWLAERYKNPPTFRYDTCRLVSRAEWIVIQFYSLLPSKLESTAGLPSLSFYTRVFQVYKWPHLLGTIYKNGGHSNIKNRPAGLRFTALHSKAVQINSSVFWAITRH
jgi:hypothetical protein